MDSVALQSGAVFDNKFVILEQLGAGGMGAVYKAKQVGFERIVALKLLNPVLFDSQDSASRFEREAKILSVLQHVNIARFFFYGVSHELVPFLAMEYVPGESLRKRFVAQQRLPWKQSLKMILQICSALSYAHGQGIVHRDLKPENIMISSSPSGGSVEPDESKATERIVLIDFGLSKVTDPQMSEVQKLTKTGDLIGSVNYLSPELCKGMKPDSRSDIYAVGVILYEAVSGSLPFTADSPIGVIYKHAHEQPTPLNERSLQIPVQLRLVIEKCIAKEPDARYQSAEDLKKDLEAILDNRLDQIEVQVGESKKQYAILSALIVATALLLASAAYYLVSASKVSHIDPDQVLEKKQKSNNSALLTVGGLNSMKIAELQRRVDFWINNGSPLDARKLVEDWTLVHKRKGTLTPFEISLLTQTLGRTYAALNDQGVAAKIYEDTIEKLRKDPRTKSEDLIGLLSAQISAYGWLGQSRKLKEPCDELAKILRENPQLPNDVKDEIRFQLCLALASQHLYVESLKYIDEECKDSFDQHRFGRQRATNLFALGRIEEAKAAAKNSVARSSVRNRLVGRSVEIDELAAARDAASCAEQASRFDVAVELLEPALKVCPPVVDIGRAEALFSVATWKVKQFQPESRNSGVLLDRTKDYGKWAQALKEGIEALKESAEISSRLKDLKTEFRVRCRLAYYYFLAGNAGQADQVIDSLYNFYSVEKRDDVSRSITSQLFYEGADAFSCGWNREAMLVFQKVEEICGDDADQHSVDLKKRAHTFYLAAQKKLGLNKTVAPKNGK